MRIKHSMPRLIVHGYTISHAAVSLHVAFMGGILTLCLFSCSQSPTEQAASGLGNLRGSDTLVLMGRFADCGEWGGHHEVIKVYRTDTALRALYERDTVKCPDPSYFNRRIVERSEARVDPLMEQHIVAYLKDLTERSFVNEGISNAGDAYVATRERMGLELVYRNYNQHWKGFVDLKRSLFSTQEPQ